MTSTLQSAVDRLAQAVHRFGARRRAWRVAEGLGRCAALVGGALLIWFVLDWALTPPHLLMLALFVVVLLLVPILLWRPLRDALRPIRETREALEIEARHGALDNLVIGGLQLGRKLLALEAEGQRPGFSPVLVHRLLEQGLQKTDDAALSGLIERRGARRNLWAAAVVALTILVGSLALSDAWRQRVDRLSEAWVQTLELLFPVTLEVSPGHVAVLRGSAVELRLDVRGGRRPEAVLLMAEGAAAERPDDPGPDAAMQASPLVLEAGTARHRLTDVQTPLRYAFQYGRRHTETFTIQVGDRPVIEAIQYELVYPPYTGRAPRTFTGPIPSLAALPGTRISVNFAATTDLHADACHVRWDDGMRQPIDVVGRFGHFAFTVDRTDHAMIHLTGILGAGFEAERPESLRIALQTDEPPVIRARVRESRILLSEAAAEGFSLGWEATDDFGVAEVELHYRIEPIDPLLGGSPREASRTYRPEPVLPRARGTFADLFDDTAPPVPGERVTLRLLARDNNTETGPGIGRAAPVTIDIIGSDPAAFRERGRRGFHGGSLLGGLDRISRRTDLLVMPTRTVTTQEGIEVQRSRVRAQVDSGAAATGAGDDAVGAYFRLLAGTEDDE